MGTDKKNDLLNKNFFVIWMTVYKLTSVKITVTIRGLFFWNITLRQWVVNY